MKHIQNLVLAHLDVDSVLSDQQWGFLQGRSTAGALLNELTVGIGLLRVALK